MAYQTGTSTGPADLLSKLITFALANGWTSTAVTGGSVINIGSVRTAIRATATAIELRGCLSANGGANWDAQPNQSTITSQCNTGAGPVPAYHFYADAESGVDRLHAVIEVAAGVYRHIVICGLIKMGAFTGGTYVCGTKHDTSEHQTNQPDSGNHHYIGETSCNFDGSHVWCDADGRVNSWSQIYNAGDFTVTRAIGSVRGAGINYDNWYTGYARWNMRTILQPIWLFQNRPSSLRSIIGRLPNIRIVNMALYPVGFQENIGGENWDMWPATARHVGDTIGTTVPSSGAYGYALRRIV